MSHYLANRDNWQQGANQGGASAERDVKEVIRHYLEHYYPGEYDVVKHPNDLKQLYYEYTYEQDPAPYKKPDVPTVDDVWYDADKKAFMTMKGGKEVVASGGGCIPDVKIQRKSNGLRCFLECKNQNDAGNAHERAAKYATPSIISFVQKKLGVNYHPFAHIFTGAMVDSRKYVVELMTTYGFAPHHLFLWKKEHPEDPLVHWLETVILPPLRV
jgi:hypothetical protein